ncbi:MAG: Wzy polymerase domain-containing protein [Gallionella sp.]
MLKNTLRSASLTHISLALVGLMWVLPFLNYRHEYPLTTFYQEWWSALLGLMALTLLTGRDFWKQPEIPRIAQLPAALIGVVLVQWGLGKVAYFDQALLYILYLLFAALLMLLGARLRDSLGIEKMSMVLAIFLLSGAELSALIGVVQHFQWHTPLDSVVVRKISSSVYGNIAQANHFANYIALGMISLGLLFKLQKLRAILVALLAMPMLFVMSLSGSRSSWLYLLMMAVLAWWWARHDARQRPLLRYSLLLVAGFAIMNFVVQLPFVAGAESSVNTVQRLFGDNATGGVRLFLWREASLMFLQSPMLGVGFGQFAWHHFQLLPSLHPNGIVGLYNNAHNLIFQVAAEAGIAGLLALLLSLGVWLFGLRRSALDESHWWGYAALGVLAIHSMLEYPLWYTYFVAIAAILLGALDETRYRLELRNIGRISVFVALLLGLTSLLQLKNGYHELENVYAIRSASSIDADGSKLLRDKLVAIHGGSLLSPYAELLMSTLIEVNNDHLREKLAVNTRVMHFVPISPVVYRQVLLLAQAGELKQAQDTLEQAIWSYPNDYGKPRQQMLEMTEKDPAHFSALLEFALKQEQEYRSAVHKQ